MYIRVLAIVAGACQLELAYQYNIRASSYINMWMHSRWVFVVYHLHDHS